ncbi:HK97 gp10 family phage protein [Streptococcus pyogenes]|uniref:HK97 gp10 family phage protein n=1 Tax=Streptococcus pyogenes TaxID=1314 RepID=UPI00109BB3CD|nr:HK97 gp10 family phage protein [Streptococcus pyogenes]HER4818907.1 HK97 gp10 family phage protein [Streptococcus pyogenes NGAS008]VGQ61751.1 prophage pi2 protein 37 [Streptococcus pyogenes]VGQ65128.1 prophage pi2 protein 37 [Streptococcus pyogenes]VHB02913.1 prophage pi2 protein 37 [Streptococcus pyogenes]VHC13168.1 prophage pi2 protein 37 [Streptococcus pyogenes]
MGSGSVKMTPLKVDIKNQVLDNIKKAAQSTESDIRAGSPRRNGVYEKGWTHDIIEENAVVHNNGKEKTLSHLLENGHATKNGGFVAPREHIRPAYLKNKEKFLNDMKSIKITPK